MRVTEGAGRPDRLSTREFWVQPQRLRPRSSSEMFQYMYALAPLPRKCFMSRPGVIGRAASRCLPVAALLLGLIDRAGRDAGGAARRSARVPAHWTPSPETKRGDVGLVRAQSPSSRSSRSLERAEEDLDAARRPSRGRGGAGSFDEPRQDVHVQLGKTCAELNSFCGITISTSGCLSARYASTNLPKYLA